MRSRGRRNRAVALIAAACAPVLALAAANYEVTIVDLMVNGQAQGQVFVLEDERSRFLVEEDLLGRWKILQPWPPAVITRGRSWIPLDSLPGVTARFDPRAMVLSVELPPALLPTQRVTGWEPARPTPTTGVGFFADYDLSYQQQSGGAYDSFSGLLSVTAFGASGSLTARALYRNVDTPVAAADDRNGSTLLDVAWVRDDPERMRSYRAGDALARSGMLGRTLRFGGVQVATNFETRPGLITHPLPSFYGETALPTALDVYVNGQLRYRENVAPGGYLLDSVPVITGDGQMQVVATDALGRQQVFIQDFYVSPELLREGLHDYSFSLGALREGYGLESLAYGDFIASGTWRYGYRDNLTLEGHLESGRGTTALSGGVQYLVGAGGVLNAGLGFSGGDAGGGAQWLLGFEQVRGLWNYRLRTAGTTTDFRLVDGEDAIPQFQLLAGTGLVLPGAGSLSATLSRENFTVKPDRLVANASFNGRLENGLAYSVFVSRIESADDDLIAGIRFSLPFGARRSTSGTLTRTDGQLLARAEYRQNLPAGTGYGYHVAASADGSDYVDAGFDAQNDYGLASVNVRTSGGSGTTVQLGASGSIAHLAGMTRLSRRIQDAFAIVDVGDYEGVRVYFENQEVGKTDADGRVFVPGLRPYQRNQLRIEPTDLPLNARAATTHAEIAPFVRSGVVVDFGVTRARDVLFRVVLPDGRPLPEGAVARVMGRRDLAPVGTDGRLYLQDIDRPSQVTIRWNGHVCDIVVPVPDGPGMIGRPGDMVCEPRAFR